MIQRDLFLVEDPVVVTVLAPPPVPPTDITDDEAIKEAFSRLRHDEQKIKRNWRGRSEVPWARLEIRFEGIERRIEQLRMWWYGCSGRCVESGSEIPAEVCSEYGCRQIDRASAVKDAFYAIQGMARYQKPKKKCTS